MPNLNRVFLMGNLTRDPELRYLPSNRPTASVGLATNRTWYDENKEKKSETTYIDCDAHDKTAETIYKYLKKGSPAYFEGRLKFDTWQDEEGNKQSKLRVVIERFEFLSTKAEQQPQKQSQPQPVIEDDDIPF